MKFIFKVFICLFVINFSYSQKNNIYIEYSLRITDDNGSFTKDKNFAETFINAIKEADKLKFGLIITKQGSKFYDLNEGIEKSHEQVMARIYANYLGYIYNLNDEILIQSEFLGKNIYKKETKKENWLITKETKKIDNYLCYKATNTNVVVNPKGEFKFPVTAWFCPEIPVSFGPSGYGNLPGLILELQVRNVSYIAKKIDLKTTYNFDRDFLESATILTKEELDKKLNEFNNFKEN